MALFTDQYRGPTRASARKAFRRLLSAGGLITAPGVYDGLSARVAAAAGFDALYVSGGAISRSMGFPDVGLVSGSEMLKRVSEIQSVTSAPLIVDADTGYGNAINVIRTVQDLERLGVAALHIEDQVNPKRCGHYEDKEVVSLGEMVGKVQAAVAARTDPDLVIIARTDARAVLGLDAALTRAKAFASAGADMIFVEAPRTVDEIAQIANEIDTPLLINMFQGGKTPVVAPETLKELGYRVMIVPSDLQRAAIRAMQRTASVLKEHGNTTTIADELASFQEREAIVGTADVLDLQNTYMQEDE